MGKFWGPGPSGNSNSTQPPESYHETAEPNERTSLIRAAYPRLSFDDPAVSPYNLFSVRSLRWVSIAMLIVSLLWCLVLLVSMFATPPGFHTRGSGFFAFAFSSLATGILFVLLLFYATPSKAERVVLSAIFFFLTADTIIILASYPIRHEENWVGIVSVFWALLVTAWAVVCDRVVEYGKREEEVRLVGCASTGHSFRQWLSVLAGTVLLTASLVITILFTINLSIRAHDTTLAAPGKLVLVDNNKYHIHLYCRGNKTNAAGHTVTTVFLEGGENPVTSRLETWVADAYASKAISRYCYWDRPGMAWSENAPSPLSAGVAVDALSEALRKTGEEGPWVLVSHGVGGIYSRVFASRHSTQVRGLLLIDALPESLLFRIGGSSRGFLLWLRGVVYPLGLDQFVSAIILRHNRNDRVYGCDARKSGGQIKAMLQENLVATSSTLKEIDSARAILPREIPVVVVSSGVEVKRSQEWFGGQRKLREISDKVLAWDVVDGAGHEVWRNYRGKELLEKRLVQLVNHK